MNNAARAEAILTARYQTGQMEGDGAASCFDAPAAVEELHAAGLLAPDPQVIRTREELAALDPDTVLVDTNGATYVAWEAQKYPGDLDLYADDLPAVVLATGDHARAAMEALEEA